MAVSGFNFPININISTHNEKQTQYFGDSVSAQGVGKLVTAGTEQISIKRILRPMARYETNKKLQSSLLKAIESCTSEYVKVLEDMSKKGLRIQEEDSAHSVQDYQKALMACEFLSQSNIFLPADTEMSTYQLVYDGILEGFGSAGKVYQGYVYAPTEFDSAEVQVAERLVTEPSKSGTDIV